MGLAGATIESLVSIKLTSWKEIAQYLHKGVRTVQRSEQEIGLPIRRSHGRRKGAVPALPDEIEVWMRSQF